MIDGHARGVDFSFARFINIMATVTALCVLVLVLCTYRYSLFHYSNSFYLMLSRYS